MSNLCQTCQFDRDQCGFTDFGMGPNFTAEDTRTGDITECSKYKVSAMTATWPIGKLVVHDAFYDMPIYHYEPLTNDAAGEQIAELDSILTELKLSICQAYGLPPRYLAPTAESAKSFAEIVDKKLVKLTKINNDLRQQLGYPERKDDDV